MEKFEDIMDVGGQRLDLSRPVVMGILNVTPDSFWEGSRMCSAGQIRDRAAGIVEQGAAVIDVGGYSSRPGADDVSPEEEYERVARAMEVIRREHPQTVVSVDTFRADVARRITEGFGKIIVNDISAGELDPDMLQTVGELGLPYIAMHMRGTPADMQRGENTRYDDITQSVKEYFADKLRELEVAGVRDIILDPGFGFAKTTGQNYALMKRMHELGEFGLPVLSGISRKSMIYKLLGITPADALPGTCALNWESLRQGASILRVHDVREAVEIVRMFNCYNEAR